MSQCHLIVNLCQIVLEIQCTHYYKQAPGFSLYLPGKPGKMRVHLENLEIWNFENFNKYHGKIT